MYLGAMARQVPDKPAVVCGDESVSYAELDARSNRLAHLFRAWGLREGDGIAMLIGNEPRFFDFAWAAMRSGLYCTPINTHLASAEMQYIADNCDAKVFIVSNALREAAAQFANQLPKAEHRIICDEMLTGFEPYPHVADGMPGSPIEDEREGFWMFYSSGTTGRPKGIRRPLPGIRCGEGMGQAASLVAAFKFDRDDRYLSVGPLYHSAPASFSLVQHRVGATVVVMPRFDAQESLRLIKRHRVTTSQWVPTHFVRLLHLPPQVRDCYDLSSHRLAIHAAAPCPIEIKRQMIDWWGPIVEEYYGSSESGLRTLVGSEEWLKHPGTVGRAIRGKVWILDEEGRELPAGQPGLIYFEARLDPLARFTYYNDPQKTAQVFRGELFTSGDMGYLDAEGYLYLTDRQSLMIISGGVNIYPAEVENALIMHPAVADVAVIGVPDAEMGEQVKAIVQLREGYGMSDALAHDIIAFCRERIAHFKCPRTVDFIADMPRSAAGKLLKRVLRDPYWADLKSRI